jgi:hypothetical protein
VLEALDCARTRRAGLRQPSCFSPVWNIPSGISLERTLLSAPASLIDITRRD